MAKLTNLDIAQIAHEANRAYCTILQDTAPSAWKSLSRADKDARGLAVQYVIDNAGDVTPAKMHSQWVKSKKKSGWVYGGEKDEILKTHPKLLPYPQLGPDQKKKDELFIGIVLLLK